MKRVGQLGRLGGPVVGKENEAMRAKLNSLPYFELQVKNDNDQTKYDENNQFINPNSMSYQLSRTASQSAGTPGVIVNRAASRTEGSQNPGIFMLNTPSRQAFQEIPQGRLNNTYQCSSSTSAQSHGQYYQPGRIVDSGFYSTQQVVASNEDQYSSQQQSQQAESQQQKLQMQLQSQQQLQQSSRMQLNSPAVNCYSNTPIKPYQHQSQQQQHTQQQQKHEYSQQQQQQSSSYQQHPFFYSHQQEQQVCLSQNSMNLLLKEEEIMQQMEQLILYEGTCLNECFMQMNSKVSEILKQYLSDKQCFFAQNLRQFKESAQLFKDTASYPQNNNSIQKQHKMDALVQQTEQLAGRITCMLETTQLRDSIKETFFSAMDTAKTDMVGSDNTRKEQTISNKENGDNGDSIVRSSNYQNNHRNIDHLIQQLPSQQSQLITTQRQQQYQQSSQCQLNLQGEEEEEKQRSLVIFPGSAAAGNKQIAATSGYAECMMRDSEGISLVTTTREQSSDCQNHYYQYYDGQTQQQLSEMDNKLSNKGLSVEVESTQRQMSQQQPIQFAQSDRDKHNRNSQNSLVEFNVIQKKYNSSSNDSEHNNNNHVRFKKGIQSVQEDSIFSVQDKSGMLQNDCRSIKSTQAAENEHSDSQTTNRIHGKKEEDSRCSIHMGNEVFQSEDLLDHFNDTCSVQLSTTLTPNNHNNNNNNQQMVQEMQEQFNNVNDDTVLGLDDTLSGLRQRLQRDNNISNRIAGSWENKLGLISWSDSLNNTLFRNLTNNNNNMQDVKLKSNEKQQQAITGYDNNDEQKASSHNNNNNIFSERALLKLRGSLRRRANRSYHNNNSNQEEDNQEESTSSIASSSLQPTGRSTMRRRTPLTNTSKGNSQQQQQHQQLERASSGVMLAQIHQQEADDYNIDQLNQLQAQHNSIKKQVLMQRSKSNNYQDPVRLSVPKENDMRNLHNSNSGNNRLGQKIRLDMLLNAQSRTVQSGNSSVAAAPVPAGLIQSSHNWSGYLHPKSSQLEEQGFVLQKPRNSHSNDNHNAGSRVNTEQSNNLHGDGQQDTKQLHWEVLQQDCKNFQQAQNQQQQGNMKIDRQQVDNNQNQNMSACFNYYDTRSQHSRITGIEETQTVNVSGVLVSAICTGDLLVLSADNKQIQYQQQQQQQQHSTQCPGMLQIYNLTSKMLAGELASKVVLHFMMQISQEVLALGSKDSQHIKILNLSTMQVETMLQQPSNQNVSHLIAIRGQTSISDSRMSTLISCGNDGSMAVWAFNREQKVNSIASCEGRLKQKIQNQHAIQLSAVNNNQSTILAVDAISRILVFAVIFDNQTTSSSYRELQEVKLSKTIISKNILGSYSMEGITALNFSFKDNTTAAIGCTNGTVTLIDVSTENILQVIKLNNMVPIRQVLLIQSKNLGKQQNQEVTPQGYQLLIGKEGDDNLIHYSSQDDSTQVWNTDSKYNIQKKFANSSLPAFFVYSQAHIAADDIHEAQSQSYQLTKKSTQRQEKQEPNQQEQQCFPQLCTLNTTDSSFTLWSLIQSTASIQ